jgi:hypothetical protein
MKSAMRRRYTGETRRTTEMIRNTQLPDERMQGARDYLARDQLRQDMEAGRQARRTEEATGPENIAKERFYTGAQGRTLGAAPLIQGAINIPISAMMYPFLTQEQKAGRSFDQFVSDMSSVGYDQARGSIDRAREKRPLESLGLEIAGGFIAGKTAYDDLGNRFLASQPGARGALVGAGSGAQYEFLESEGDPLAAGRGALIGAPVGAGVSKAMEATAEPLGRLFRGEVPVPKIGPDATNAIVGGTLGGIAPAETAEERAQNIALGAGLGAAARTGSQAVNRVSDRVLGSGNPNLKGVDKKRQAYTFDVGGAKAKVTFVENFPDDGDYPRRVPTELARLREDVRREFLTPREAFIRSVEAIVPDRYNRNALGPTGPKRMLEDSVIVRMDISNNDLTLPQAKQLFEKTFDTLEDHAIRHKRPVYYFTGAKPSQDTLYENNIKRRGAPKGYVATTGPDGFYFVRDDLFQNFAKELQDDGYDVITRTASKPRAAPDTMPAGAGDNPYFGRQSMRPSGSGPSPREIETRQQWATATPIVTQARTTAQSAQQAADAALQSKAPADIARAKDQKKTLVGQIKEAQASRAGMDTPEDARLAETLASLSENTSDPVLLSTQISAAKTSLDRLLTDIGSPAEGNLIPVKTNILTRTQAPRSAAEGPQERPSVTRYAEGEVPPIKGMGFGAGTPKTPQQAARFETPGSPEWEAAVAKGLDMSQAGRMARRKAWQDELGTDPEIAETVLYHGTGKDFDAFNPTADGAFGPGIYLTESAEDASQFAVRGGRRNPSGNGASVLPVVVRGRFATPRDYTAAINAAKGVGAARQEEALAALRKSGFDGVKTAPNAGNPSHIVIFDPSNIRSVNAAFDPEKSGSSTLLAAAPFAAVGGVGASAAMGEDD